MADEHEHDEEEPQFSLEEFMHSIAVTAMLQSAMENALNEFVEVRWPHLIEHGAVTEEDGGNPFTGGCTALFLSMNEMKALDAVFMEMRKQETLPGHICPFASFIHHVLQRTGEAEKQAKVYEHAQQLRPDEPGLN